MPKGVYIRTEKHNENLSKARRRWMKENPEIFNENCRKGGINVWRDNREKMLEGGFKKAWKNNRERMLEILEGCHKAGSASLKRRWKNNREEMIEHSRRGGEVGGKINGGKSFKRIWDGDREKMLKGCRRGGRVGGEIGGKALKRAWKINRKEMLRLSHEAAIKASVDLKKRWENNREEMLEICSRGDKIGGKVNWENNRGKMLKILSENREKAWKNDREKMLENCRKGGKASIQKQQKVRSNYIELIVRNYLDKNKIRHKDNVWFDHKEADIVIPRYKLIIECDGWMHDVYENVKKNDKLKTKLFNKLGYKVLRLKGSEIRNGSFVNKFLKKIANIKPRVLLRRRENYETNRV